MDAESADHYNKKLSGCTTFHKLYQQANGSFQTEIVPLVCGQYHKDLFRGKLNKTNFLGYTLMYQSLYKEAQILSKDLSRLITNLFINLQRSYTYLTLYE